MRKNSAPESGALIRVKEVRARGQSVNRREQEVRVPQHAHRASRAHYYPDSRDPPPSLAPFLAPSLPSPCPRNATLHVYYGSVPQPLYDYAELLRETDARCEHCDFPLRGLTRPICSECGYGFTGELLTMPPPRPPTARTGARRMAYWLLDTKVGLVPPLLIHFAGAFLFGFWGSGRMDNLTYPVLLVFLLWLAAHELQKTPGPYRHLVPPATLCTWAITLIVLFVRIFV